MTCKRFCTYNKRFGRGDDFSKETDERRSSRKVVMMVLLSSGQRRAFFCENPRADPRLNPRESARIPRCRALPRLAAPCRALANLGSFPPKSAKMSLTRIEKYSEQGQILKDPPGRLLIVAYWTALGVWLPPGGRRFEPTKSPK